MGLTNADKKQRMRLRNALAGLCSESPNHGPAIMRGKCLSCAQYHAAKSIEGYERRINDGYCTQGRRHGLAMTGGTLCEPCARKTERSRAEERAKCARERMVKTCIAGNAHGPVIEGGQWCRRCSNRRTAAAERVARRGGMNAPPAPGTAPAPSGRDRIMYDDDPRIARFRAAVQRGGNIDSQGLLQSLMDRM
jgi:hypothetical protein